MSAPAFLNKPKHKDVVVATSKGWVVEKTGELLVSVKNLDQRIAEHLGLNTFKFEPAQTMTLPHTGPDAEIATLPHTGEDAVIAPLSAAASIDSLLDGLDTAKSDEVVKDVVEDVVKEVVEQATETPPVKEKSKRGGYRPRKPKVVA